MKTKWYKRHAALLTVVCSYIGVPSIILGTLQAFPYLLILGATSLILGAVFFVLNAKENTR